MSGWVGEAVYDMDFTEMPSMHADAFSGAGRGVMGLRSGFGSLTGNMRALGVLSDDLLEPLEKMSAALQITAGGYQVYRALRSAMASYRAMQLVAASAETAAAVANPLRWPVLALAGAAAASVYAALQVQTGEWDLPGADVGSPAQREQAAMDVGGITNGQ